MPMQGFGIFALAVVSIDYFLIIVILPAYYIFYEEHIKPRFSWIAIFRKVTCRKPLALPVIE